MVAHRAFGADALGQIGLALVVLVIVAVATVRLGRHVLKMSREVTPRRVSAGKTVTITLRIVNEGRGAAPLVLVEDSIPAQLAARARFAFSGIESLGDRLATYQLRPQMRGRYRLGPAEVSFLDPFSLARTRMSLGDGADLLVHPPIEELVLPRDLGERRSLTLSATRRPTGAEGEDFYTLRDYIEGDDLRKIHWPSTAKRQRYMIRQEETPWHNRATIVLDDRRGAHGAQGAQSFEFAVAAAASLVDLYHRSGYSFRLAGAHEPGLAASRGAEHYNRCLDLLATITLKSAEAAGPDPHDPMLLARLAELEARESAEGSLVVVGGDLDPEIAVGLSRLRRRFRQIIAVSLPPHRFGSGPTRARWDAEGRTMEVVRLLARSGVRTIVLGPGDHLRLAWGSLSRTTTGGGETTWDRKHAPV
ncbi:MAG TPA: DUF58 domain-containing protein [Actinomycetota bacterium]|nr:DUF58 domain-containing protein [Actinomycetota bacterium]